MRNIRQLLVAFLMSAVVACGGGGTLDSNGSSSGTYTLTASIAPSANLADGNPLTVNVQLRATSGSISGQLVTFTVSDAELATFSNQAGTALTDSNGNAAITLVVGSKSGAGTVTASVASGAKATVGFVSAGKVNTNDQLQLTLSMAATKQPATPTDPSAPKKTCAANQVSRDCTPQVTVKVTTLQGSAVTNRQVKLTIPDSDLARARFTGGLASQILSLDSQGQAKATLQVGTEPNDGQVVATIVDVSTVAAVSTSFSSDGDYYSVKLLANRTQLGTGNADPVELTALVRDPGNVVVQNVPVEFSTAASAEIEVTARTTNASGAATARLTSKTSFEVKDISATARVNKNVTSDIKLSVFGSRIDVQAPTSVVKESEQQIVVTLLDSTGAPIPREAVTLEVNGSNNLVAGGKSGNKIEVDTDGAGKIVALFQANVAGDAVVKFNALNDTVASSRNIVVNSDKFAFSNQPDVVTEVNIEGDANATRQSVNWLRNGSSVSAADVRFVTNRGVLQSSFANPVDVTQAGATVVKTDENGIASVFARSTFTGFTSIDATAIQNGNVVASARKRIEFISTNPSKIEVQVTPTRVGVGERSTVRAIVRDARNNPVKNAAVVFRLENSAGGTLNPVEVVTDSQGVAATEFTADQTTGANTGANLNIGAYVRNVPTVAGNTPLVVGKRTMFFRIGTGNEITNLTSSSYAKEFNVIVTDVAGNPVVDQLLNVTVVPRAYAYGRWTPFYKDGTTFLFYTPVRDRNISCANEDTNNNGILDAGEDSDGNNQLTPGNVASVRFLKADGSEATELRSNSAGVARLHLVYPEDRAGWVDVDLIISDKAEGTENVATSRFTLVPSSEDVTKEQNPPPPNPYGVTGECPAVTN